MERRSVATPHVDPLLPSLMPLSATSPEASEHRESRCRSLEREILDDLPMKIHIGHTDFETRRNVVRFARLLSLEMRARPQAVSALSNKDLEPIKQWMLEIESYEERSCLSTCSTEPTLMHDTDETRPQESAGEDMACGSGTAACPTTDGGGLSKEDVYWTVRLARPVVECLYVKKVSRLVQELQKISSDAAARVQEFCNSCATADSTHGTDSVNQFELRETVPRQFKRRRILSTEGEVQFGSIRWTSSGRYEFFEFVDDLGSLLKHQPCYDMGVHPNLKIKFSTKGYKLAHLWRRFILKGGNGRTEFPDDTDILYHTDPDASCVCEGRGWVEGNWTCTCVRDLIGRIRIMEPVGAVFASAVFALLCRYHSICGSQNQGKGLHYAIPPRVLDVLHDDMQVNCELFASPFNVHLADYCSIFPDVDVMFGSGGSFFDSSFEPVEGSFEANPPFDEVIMARMVTRILCWLKGSEGVEGESRPLSFCLALPDWSNGPSDFMDMITKTEFLRYSEVLPGGKHVFVSGFQHFCHASDLEVPAVCGTFFAVLQNEAASKVWPVTDAFKQRLKAAWSTPEPSESSCELL
ncbi:hypothetical protein BESB_059510 [Besnoitia besnoiti]|uniref:PCIF1 WW domain-containing protein n=1 Tax=Besnoitia besnoiti TaxID=94643 RepID=A0A2A9MCX3_BESBE|nr:hypothetical protein BESB_059510 [Besnoitia besnoiti]PFH35064.1 hypothetical protein BESB_059510 [Besnoitia besnoiti]